MANKSSSVSVRVAPENKQQTKAVSEKNSKANKSANISVRVAPEIKQQAEAVLKKIGIPVSVLIDTLYRQVIYTGGIPYPLTVPKLTTLDAMGKSEFDTMMEASYNQATAGEGIELDAAFEGLRKRIEDGIQG